MTAEGVETDEQHKVLKQLGCDKVQGYLISKPVTVEQIDVLLDKYNKPGQVSRAA